MCAMYFGVCAKFVKTLNTCLGYLGNTFGAMDTSREIWEVYVQLFVTETHPGKLVYLSAEGKCVLV